MPVEITQAFPALNNTIMVSQYALTAYKFIKTELALPIGSSRRDLSISTKFEKIGETLLLSTTAQKELALSKVENDF